MKPNTKAISEVAKRQGLKTTVTTSIVIDIDTYERAQKFMINEYKHNGRRLFLKDIVSPAIDLYIATMGGGK